MQYERRSDWVRANKFERLCKKCSAFNPIKEIKKIMEADKYELVYNCICGEHIERVAFRHFNVKCPKCYSQITEDEE